jgi:ketosteroid isomerase-like protein
MPEESTTPDLVEVTRRLFWSVNEGDFDGMMSFFGDDSVWDVRPWGLGAHSGTAAIRQFLEQWMGSFDEYQVEVEEMLDLGNGVVLVIATQYAHSAGSRGQLRLRYAPVFVWAGEVAVQVTHYRDIDEARAASKRLAAERG